MSEVRFFGEARAHHTADDGTVTRLGGSNIVHEGGLKYHQNLLSQASSARSLYVGLADGTDTIASADTLSARVANEVTAFSGSARPEWQAALSGLDLDNSANVASWSISSAVTISGPFITDNSSAGSDGGSNQLLLSSATFDGGNAQLSSGTLEVTYTHSAAT